MLDGEHLPLDEFLALLDALEKEGPVPAGQSEEETEKAWQRYKKEHGIK